MFNYTQVYCEGVWANHLFFFQLIPAFDGIIGNPVTSFQQ